MNAELEAHVDGLTERNIAAGMSPEDARYAALREFGGVAQIAERARDERRSVWVEQAYQDVRYAVRSLAKSPSFTITAVLTLALGIGVNAALFSVVNMVALRPLPLKDPDSLVQIRGRNERGGFMGVFTYADYVAYRDGNSTFDGIVAIHAPRWSFQEGPGAELEPGFGERPSSVLVALVPENYFSVLGGRVQFGRTFLPEDCTQGAAPVVVLSHVFWQTRLHGDPDVIGRTLTFGRHRVTVIGVASPEFSGDGPVPPAGWLPLVLWSSRAADYAPNGPLDFFLVGRLAPGITEAQAQADLDAIAARRAVEFPGDEAKTSVRLERGLRFIRLNHTGNGGVALATVYFSFGLVLVIACTNVANLLLARGVSRQSEIGIRLTLGASRGRIIRQLLTENLLLCVVGGLIGLGLATWTLQLLLPMVVSRLPVDWAFETRHLAFFKTTPDRRVLGFTLFLTVGAAIVAGLLPALHASGASLVATVRNEVSAFGRRLTPSRLRQLLVITQVAISITLLSCAGLLARNLFALQKVDVGFDAHAVFGVSMAPNAATANRNAAFRQGWETVRSIPGVAASAVASPAPLMGETLTPIRPVQASGGEAKERVGTSRITDGFFETFRIPLLGGRDFRQSDLHSESRAIIVSESLARRLWPGEGAIGRTLAVGEEAWSTPERPAPAGAFRDCEVIGVARDIMWTFVHDNRRKVYLPLALDTARYGSVFLRPQSDSAAALMQITREAKAAGTDLQFERRHSFWLEFFVLPFFAFAVASGALGGLALAMASVGLFGLMTFTVNQRVREIGIRMALGATSKKVVGLFVRQGMRLVAIGLVLGLAGGGLFALLLEKVFFGLIDAFDPVAYVAVTLLFALIALFACWLPARRATKVDPMVALRAE